MSRILKSAMAITLAMSVGCVYTHPQPKEAQEELALSLSQAGLADVPDDVLNELNPDNPLDDQYSINNANRISIAANNVPAAEFFARIMNQSNSSVVVHPEVSGNITLNLDNVTTDEVFDAVYRMYGYYTEKRDSVYYVYPAGIHTENISINYLSMIREAETKLSIVNNTVSNSSDDSEGSSGGSSGSSGDSGDSDSESSSGTKVTTTAKSDFWTELQTVLSSLVGSAEGRLVKVNPHAAMVTVRGMPEDIQNVKNYLNSIESHLHRQVVIESKIIEVTLNENYSQGIDWSAITGHTFKFGNAKPFGGGGTGDSIIGVLGGGLSFSAESSHFNALLNFLKTQGDVSTLSSPRITALNNQKAVMKVGTDSYFLTDISVDTSASTTTSSNYLTSDVTFKPFFSGVSLDVLPQINENNEVLMHIHPAVIDVQQDNKVVNLGGGSSSMDLPLASSQVRETDTIVKVKSGDVILIGGLMRTEVGELVSKVPVLGDIPYLGELFTNRNNYNHKKELVILLKPVVVDGDTWKNEINKSVELLKKWYPDDESKGSDADILE